MAGKETDTGLQGASREGKRKAGGRPLQNTVNVTTGVIPLLPRDTASTLGLEPGMAVG